MRAAGFAGGIGLAPFLSADPTRATPDMMEEAIRKTIGEATISAGRITLDVPPLVENGNTVPLTVSVDSPMTAADHVTAIHVFNEMNPQPYVISAMIGPRAGRARLLTRIKLSGSQKLIAIAAMSDGSFWSASADVIVTIAACIEDVR